MTAPVEARGDFGAIEGLISKLQSAQMKAIVDRGPDRVRNSTASTSRRLLVTIVSGSATAAMAFGAQDGRTTSSTCAT